MKSRAKKEIGKTAEDGVSRTLDHALIPIVFTLLGWFLDRRLGTYPVLTVVGFAYGFVGSFVLAIFSYRSQIAKLAGNGPTGPKLNLERHGN